jgi:DnaJ-class molecular chaperone
MPTLFTPVEATTVTGTFAPECEDCEGSGITTYLHGPYVRTRECDTCHGTGRYLLCPACADGVSPTTGDTCTTCDGFAALT